jgi:hypothetical protein
MGKRNLKERDDEAVEAGESLLAKLLEAANKSLTYKGKDEGPVFKLLKGNEHQGQGWLTLAFNESDGTKDPDYIKRIVGKDV